MAASLGSACTAVVLAKVSDTDDFTTLNADGTKGTPLDQCSLLKGDYYSGGDRDANACSECITTRCKDDVAYACPGDGGKKPWFDDLAKCAKEPWNGEAPPDESSSSSSTSWGCKNYVEAEDPISDNGSDTEREITAHNCVTTSCMQGSTPPCKQCEVAVKKSDSETTRALLRDDPCGKCLAENCMPELVECCDTSAVDEYVKPCAFTASPPNKTKCRALQGDPEPDAGLYYNDAGVQCIGKIARCFQANDCIARCGG